MSRLLLGPVAALFAVALLRTGRAPGCHGANDGAGRCAGGAGVRPPGVIPRHHLIDFEDDT